MNRRHGPPSRVAPSRMPPLRVPPSPVRPATLLLALAIAAAAGAVAAGASPPAAAAPAPEALPPGDAALADSVDALYAARDHAAGVALARQRLENLRAALGDRHPGTAAARHQLGLGLLSLGELDAAGAALEEALAVRVATLGERDAAVAASLHGLARLSYRRGDPRGAEAHMRRALAIARDVLGEQHLDTAQYTYGLGVALMQQGDYAAAEPFLRRALAAHRVLLPAEHAKVANNLNALAVLLKRRGDHGAAEPLYRETLAMRRRLLPADHADVAWSLSNLAGLLLDMKRYAEAEPLLRQALEIQRRLAGPGRDDPDVARTLHNLAFAAQREDRPVEAEALIREALAMTGRLEGHDGLLTAQLQHNLAQVLLDQRRPAEAAALLPGVEEAYRQLLGREHPYVVWAQADDGLCRLALGQPRQALDSLRRAAAGFETARLRAGSGTARATFQFSPYQRLAAAHLLSGLPGAAGEAWSATERSLGRALADLLFEAGRRELGDDEASREEELRWRLSQLEGQVQTLQAAAARDSGLQTRDDLDTARRSLQETEAEWSALQREIALRHPVREGRAHTLEAVQDVLAADEAIVGWLQVEIGPDDLAAWGYVVRADGPPTWSRLDDPGDPADGAARMQRVRDLREALDRAASWPFRVTDRERITAAGRELYRDWIAPLAPRLAGVRQLRVVAAGPLLGLPLEACVDGAGAYLDESRAVSYIPSATILVWLRDRAAPRRTAPRTALLLGDPPLTAEHLAAMDRERSEPGSAGPPALISGPLLVEQRLRNALAGDGATLATLPRLRWTREEIDRLAPLFRSTTVLLGPRASEQELVRLAANDALAGFDVIHLAAHALVDEHAPSRSALVLARTGLPDPLEEALAGRPVHDGLFSAGEIARHCRLRAELVTLSGCRTGLGREADGEGYLGLAHAFLQAGARSLLVSLWRVEDEATCLLMDRFYRNLLGRDAVAPLPRVEALREAKRWLRTLTDEAGERSYAHPAYWSGFVLIGAAR